MAALFGGKPNEQIFQAWRWLNPKWHSVVLHDWRHFEF